MRITGKAGTWRRRATSQLRQMVNSTGSIPEDVLNLNYSGGGGALYPDGSVRNDLGDNDVAWEQLYNDCTEALVSSKRDPAQSGKEGRQMKVLTWSFQCQINGRRWDVCSTKMYKTWGEAHRDMEEERAACEREGAITMGPSIVEVDEQVKDR